MCPPSRIGTRKGERGARTRGVIEGPIPPSPAGLGRSGRSFQPPMPAEMELIPVRATRGNGLKKKQITTKVHEPRARRKGQADQDIDSQSGWLEVSRGATAQRERGDKIGTYIESFGSPVADAACLVKLSIGQGARNATSPHPDSHQSSLSVVLLAVLRGGDSLSPRGKM